MHATRWAVVAVVLVLCAQVGFAAKQVTFKDKNLEGVIRGIINIPSGALKDTDLAPVKSFSAEDMRIADLSGLEFCTNLEAANLSSNNIRSLAPLAGLVKTQYLNLGSNAISDVGPLAKLTKLFELHLSSNIISNLKPLAGLVAIERLSLENNRISDIGALKGMPLLKNLTIYNNQITSLSPLVANTGMGGGDFVSIYSNWLDTGPTSQTFKDAEALKKRGVQLEWSGQQKPRKPGTPTGLTAKIVPTYAVELRWSNPPPLIEQSVTVQRRLPNGSWSALASLPPNSCSYIDRTTKRGCTYEYRVCLVNAIGPSPWSKGFQIKLL